MQDPVTYLLSRDVAVASFFDPDRTAIVDDAHMVRVNHDLFFFADQSERRRFRDDPLTYCETLSDPVTLERFHPTHRTPRIEHAGQVFAFESEDTFETFSTMPDSFLVPRVEMEEMESGDEEK